MFTRTINLRFIHILERDEEKKNFLKERETIPLAHMYSYNIIEYMYRF